MAAEVLLTLDFNGHTFRFGVAAAAYQALRRSAEYRWPGQERAGKGPARQFTGRDEKLDLQGVVYPHYLGGLRQLETLRTLADLGEPATLTSGRGEALGKWVVERVEETQTVFLADGTPLKQEFALGLALYG